MILSLQTAAGKLTFDTVDFDPADVARKVCSLLAEGARAKGLELACPALTATSYVLTAVLGKIFLHEFISLARWSGICVISGA